MVSARHGLLCMALMSVGAPAVSLVGGCGGGRAASGAMVTVTGSVLALPSGDGVSGVLVTVGRRAATTARDGHYTICYVVPGDVAFSVALGDGCEVVSGPPATLSIPARTTPADLDATYGPTYVIDAQWGSGSIPSVPDL